MEISVLTTMIMEILFPITILTNVTVEAVKRVSKWKWDSTLLAAIVSVIISLIFSIVYVISKGVVFDAATILAIIILAYLSFLCSTVGYDKVMEILRKIGANK